MAIAESELGAIDTDYLHLKQTIETLANEPCVGRRATFNLLDTTRLIFFTARIFGFHRRFREMISTDSTLPTAICQDPPSLRSTIWMVMVDDVLRHPTPAYKPESLEAYPLRLYALTRCYMSALDDIMDRTTPPLTKQTFTQNSGFNVILGSLSNEFRRLARQSSELPARVKKTVRNYRLARDIWIEYYNTFEQDRDSLDFDTAVRYNVLTMGPLTSILTYTLAVNHQLDPEKEGKLNEALVWYAAAGKIIDDMTDWLKDHQQGDLNIFSLALSESGEFDKVVKNTQWLQILGRRAFVPISLFHLLAPKATKRTLGIIDSYIDKLESCDLPLLTASMRGVRQMMWVYALNEGLPQV